MVHFRKKKETDEDGDYIESLPDEDLNQRHMGFTVPIYIDGEKKIRRIKKMKIFRLMKIDNT